MTIDAAALVPRLGKPLHGVARNRDDPSPPVPAERTKARFKRAFAQPPKRLGGY